MFLMFAKFCSTITMIFKFIVGIQSILRLCIIVHNIDIKNLNKSFDFTYSASLRCLRLLPRFQPIWTIDILF